MSFRTQVLVQLAAIAEQLGAAAPADGQFAAQVLDYLESIGVQIPAGLISSDADNALELGSDDKLYAASGGGGGFQFMSGTENPPTTEPDDTAVGAVYYNTSTKFSWNWNIGAQAWVAAPKVYRALLTQSGTDAPTAVVLENTLGDTLVWTYEESGSYKADGTVPYAEISTMVFVGNKSFGGGTGHAFAVGNIIVYSFDATGAPVDSTLSATPIEILVYP